MKFSCYFHLRVDLLLLFFNFYCFWDYFPVYVCIALLMVFNGSVDFG